MSPLLLLPRGPGGTCQPQQPWWRTRRPRLLLRLLRRWRCASATVVCVWWCGVVVGCCSSTATAHALAHPHTCCRQAVETAVAQHARLAPSSSASILGADGLMMLVWWCAVNWQQLQGQLAECIGGFGNSSGRRVSGGVRGLWRAVMMIKGDACRSPRVKELHVSESCSRALHTTHFSFVVTLLRYVPQPCLPVCWSDFAIPSSHSSTATARATPHPKLSCAAPLALPQHPHVHDPPVGAAPVSAHSLHLTGSWQGSPRSSSARTPATATAAQHASRGRDHAGRAEHLLQPGPRLLCLRHHQRLQGVQLRPLQGDGASLSSASGPATLRTLTTNPSLCADTHATHARNRSSAGASTMAASASWRCCSAATSWPSLAAAQHPSTHPPRCVVRAASQAGDAVTAVPSSSSNSSWSLALTHAPPLCWRCRQVMIWDDHQAKCIGELSFRSQVWVVEQHSAAGAVATQRTLQRANPSSTCQQPPPLCCPRCLRSAPCGCGGTASLWLLSTRCCRTTLQTSSCCTRLRRSATAGACWRSRPRQTRRCSRARGCTRGRCVVCMGVWVPGRRLQVCCGARARARDARTRLTQPCSCLVSSGAHRAL